MTKNLRDKKFAERDVLKERVKKISCRRYLEKAPRSPKRGDNGYVCYACKSGLKKNGTGAVTYNPERNTWYCCECGAGADVIELYMLREGIGFNRALEELARELDDIGMDREEMRGASEGRIRQPGASERGRIVRSGEERSCRPLATGGGENRSRKKLTASDMRISEGLEETRGALGGIGPAEMIPDFTEYLELCRERLSDPDAIDYLTKRGISENTARLCGIGYDPAADPAGDPGRIGYKRRVNNAKRIIIPSSVMHYVGRRIDNERRFEKIEAKGGRKGVFNGAVFENEALKEIFVCEGPFDALSVIEIGPQAVALFGTGINKLLDLIKCSKMRTVLILCLDNDAAGKRTVKDLAVNLDKMGIKWIEANISGDYKDPNEALIADRESFERRVFDAVSVARNIGTMKRI